MYAIHDVGFITYFRDSVIDVEIQSTFHRHFVLKHVALPTSAIHLDRCSTSHRQCIAFCLRGTDTTQRTPRTVVLNNFFRGLQGGSGILTRTTNMVHTLGYLSVLSCIDKRGILAQPMPAPETMFLFSDVTDGPDDADSAGEENESGVTTVDGKSDEHSNADDVTDVTDAASSRGDVDDDEAARSVASSQSADKESTESQQRATPAVRVSEQNSSAVVVPARIAEEVSTPRVVDDTSHTGKSGDSYQSKTNDDEGNDSWDEDNNVTGPVSTTTTEDVSTFPAPSTEDDIDPSEDLLPDVAELEESQEGTDAADHKGPQEGTKNPVMNDVHAAAAVVSPAHAVAAPGGAAPPVSAAQRTHAVDGTRANSKASTSRRRRPQRQQRSQSSSTAERTMPGHRKRHIRRVVL